MHRGERACSFAQHKSSCANPLATTASSRLDCDERGRMARANVVRVASYCEESVGHCHGLIRHHAIVPVRACNHTLHLTCMLIMLLSEVNGSQIVAVGNGQLPVHAARVCSSPTGTVAVEMVDTQAIIAACVTPTTRVCLLYTSDAADE